MTVQLRQITLADLPAVLDIQSACYTEIAPESRESIAAKLAASPSTCFAAVQEGRLIAYLISLPWTFADPPKLNAATCELPPKPDCLYLHDLAVSHAARGCGAGRALVEAFMSKLTELGLGRACLIAIQGSAPYWERYGFKEARLTGGLKSKLSSYGSGARYMQIIL